MDVFYTNELIKENNNQNMYRDVTIKLQLLQACVELMSIMSKFPNYT